MEIHRFEAVWTVASILLIVGWIATITYGAVGPPGIAMVDGEGGTVDPEAVADGDYGDVPGFREPGVYPAEGEDHYAAYVVARQFYFQPGTIRVPAGSTVTIYLTSGDVVHGFQVVGTNVNSMAIPGQVAQMTVRFEETATYGIVCHEYCGAGHHTMEGTLEVVPPAQFNATEA